MMERIIEPFTDILDPRSVVSYVAAGFFVLLSALVVRMLQGRRPFRMQALLRLIFRKSVFFHPSSLVDYRMYLVNLPLMVFGSGFFILNSGFWFEFVGRGLTSNFGPAAITTGVNWYLIVAIAAVQVLSMDFGYWLGHVAMHKNKFLWEFHKVHHSAEVLNFATEYRQHPIEFIIVPGTISLTTGTTFALIQYWFGADVTSTGRIGYNMVIMAHLLTFHHLRHSHLNIAFTGIWGRLLHSPGHHMLHHSNNPAHFDANMGYIFSIWDWMAGTLVLPRPGQRLELGIGPEGKLHDSVLRSFWLPFRNVWRDAMRPRVS